MGKSEEAMLSNNLIGMNLVNMKTSQLHGIWLTWLCNSIFFGFDKMAGIVMDGYQR